MYAEALRRKVGFKVVYILEAHAYDEWPVGSRQFHYPQATTLEMRAQAAHDMKTRLGLQAPIVLDSANNDFEREYAPWPFRFYVISDGKILMKPTPIDGSYDLCDLWDLLRSLPNDDNVLKQLPDTV